MLQTLFQHAQRPLCLGSYFEPDFFLQGVNKPLAILIHSPNPTVLFMFLDIQFNLLYTGQLSGCKIIVSVYSKTSLAIRWFYDLNQSITFVPISMCGARLTILILVLIPFKFVVTLNSSFMRISLYTNFIFETISHCSLSYCCCYSVVSSSASFPRMYFNLCPP